MPGITGIISFCGETRMALGSMIARMRHEPSDIANEYQDERLGLAIGWVSRPRSSTSSLPVWNEDRTVCLIFVGERLRRANACSGPYSILA